MNETARRLSIFERYPQLRTLRGLLPDEVVEREIGVRAEEFERILAKARHRIPTMNLRDAFPVEIEGGAIRLENFLGHWGNLSVEAVCKLCLIARWLRPRRVLEIGTYNGMTTLQIALNVPDECTVYTLDLPSGASPARPISELDRLVVERLRERFGTATGSYFEDRRDVKIRQLWGDSATFDYAAAINGPLDLVFIDAAHDYEHKRIDTERTLPLLSPGAVLIWDNYADVSNPDITRYLLDLCRSYRLIHLRNTMMVIYRAPGAGGAS